MKVRVPDSFTFFRMRFQLCRPSETVRVVRERTGAFVNVRSERFALRVRDLPVGVFPVLPESESKRKKNESRRRSGTHAPKRHFSVDFAVIGPRDACFQRTVFSRDNVEFTYEK